MSKNGCPKKYIWSVKGKRENAYEKNSHESVSI